MNMRNINVITARAVPDEAFHKKRESISQKARKKKQNITE